MHILYSYRNMSVDAGESQRAEIIRILLTFTHMCTLNGDDSQSHSQNQKILFNYGKLGSQYYL